MSARKHGTLGYCGYLGMCDFREFREFRDFLEFRVFELAHFVSVSRVLKLCSISPQSTVLGLPRAFVDELIDVLGHFSVIYQP